MIGEGSVAEFATLGTLATGLLALIGFVVRQLLRSDVRRDSQLAASLQAMLKQSEEQHRERSSQRERELAEIIRIHKEQQAEIALLSSAMVDVRNQMVRLVVLIAREKASSPADVLQIIDAVMASDRPLKAAKV